MSEPQMPTEATRIKASPARGLGVWHIAIGERFDVLIDKSLHFAVNPPSTIRT